MAFNVHGVAVLGAHCVVLLLVFYEPIVSRQHCDRAGETFPVTVLQVHLPVVRHLEDQHLAASLPDLKPFRVPLQQRGVDVLLQLLDCCPLMRAVVKVLKKLFEPYHNRN